MKIQPGTVFYTDRLYTSAEMGIELKSKYGIMLVGTIMPNRTLVPQCLIDQVVEKRKFIAIHTQNTNNSYSLIKIHDSCVF